MFSLCDLYYMNECSTVLLCKPSCRYYTSVTVVEKIKLFWRTKIQINLNTLQHCFVFCVVDTIVNAEKKISGKKKEKS